MVSPKKEIQCGFPNADASEIIVGDQLHMGMSQNLLWMEEILQQLVTNGN